MSVDLPRAPAEAASALPAGTRLHEFEVRRLLGVGGFGIVYLAFDHQLEREVAVKEYMPAALAGRTETMAVSLRSDGDAEVFALGLRSFVNEARLLARFDHPSLLKVLRFWEANGTAYMAMPVLQGRTLKQMRQAPQAGDPALDEAFLRALLEPLLGALDRLHAAGVYHRDIAPDNIQVEPDGHPVLLDFGAARRVIGDRTQTLTAILKPAYAPVEQYAEAGSVKQGPWTDLYALGATLHYLLLGRPPEPATARALSDDAPPLAAQRIAGCSESFLRIVDWMLAPRPGDRPQNAAEVREALAGRRELPRAPERPPVAWERTQALPGAAGSAGSAGAAGAVSDSAQRAPAAADSTLVELPIDGAPAPMTLASLPATPVASAAATAPAASATPRGRGAWLGLGAALAAGVAAFLLWPRTPAPRQPDVSQGPPTAASMPQPAAVTAAAPLTSGEPPAAVASSPGTAPATASVVAPSSTTADTPAPVRRPPPSAAAPKPAVPTEPAIAADVTRPAPDPMPASQPVTEPPRAVAPPAAPTPTAAAPAPGPAARCATRDNPIRRWACMERLCLRSEFRGHADCMQWRQEARPRE